MAAKPMVRMTGDGERRWFSGGGLHTWKVTAEESDGAFFLFEDELTEGKMTPWHCHPDTDEAIYVLEGEVDVKSTATSAHHRRRPLAGAARRPPAFTVLSPDGAAAVVPGAR